MASNSTDAQGKVMNPASIAVLGSGSWGTALALHLHRQGHDVRLWGFLEEEVNTMLAEGENTPYLPGVPLPKNLLVTTSLKKAIQDCEAVVMAVPSSAIQSMVYQLQALHYSGDFILASKGLLLSGGQIDFYHSVIEKNFSSSQVTVLSGPSFAKEVGEEQPTALVAASRFNAHAQKVQALFARDGSMRIAISDDPQGVQLGAALKNIIAVAIGLAEGLGYGENFKAYLLTQGLSDMAALGQHLGCQPETLYGLAGFGDLVLTASSNLSRNRRFGLALSEGKTIEEAFQAIGQVVESSELIEAIADYCSAQKEAYPLFEVLGEVLKAPQTAREQLLNLL